MIPTYLYDDPWWYPVTAFSAVVLFLIICGYVYEKLSK